MRRPSDGVWPSSRQSVMRLPIASAFEYIHFWKVVASFSAMVMPE